ncbi:hypothetical protein QAD02_012275 [Eretmocerus hayati]|uniref:Uncharacterized protein n=1 Tax=Eretmocerus hayati TaxID=131215 RepID=A0ACC2P044_9HYME|nr:hypothetical protein QAD02_012275 [Eretmocerus hayati]
MILCVQCDWKTKSLSSTFFNVELLKNDSVDKYAVSFANLGEERFLFVVLECGKEQGSGCKGAQGATVDSEKILLKTTPIINDLECPNPLIAKSYIGEVGDEFCFNFVCPLNESPYDSIPIQTKCILKSKF